MSLNIDLTEKNSSIIYYINNLDNDKKNEFLNYILELGYSEYNKLKNLHIENKYEISNNLIDNITNLIDNKTLKLYNVINEIRLDNKNYSSIYNINTNKGTFGENMVLEFFKNHFSNYAIEDSSSIPHSGDLKMFINDINEHVIIEIKNYKNTVDQKQVSKLYYDMEFTGINLAIFISLNSRISNIKQKLEWKFQDNKIIIFISFCSTELLYLSIYVLINLYKISKSNKIEKSSMDIGEDTLKYINRIILQKDNILQLKSNILKIHDAHSEDMLNLYNSICKFENEFKYNLSNLKLGIEDYINNMKFHNIFSNNDIFIKLETLDFSKTTRDILNTIIADLYNNFKIIIIDEKKILIKHLECEIDICEFKLLKNSINLILKNGLEIKNVTNKNWKDIRNFIK